MKTIKPFGSRILIKPQEQKGVLQSGSLCEYGEVLAVGPDVIHVHAGDVIGFLVFGVEHLEIDGEKHYFVDEKSEFILGFITDEPDK